MKIVDGIPIWGKEIDEGALAQIKTCARTADHVAMMADHHQGYAVPIGGVVAYKDSISPSGVGYDIACGNKAVKLDCHIDEIRPYLNDIMDSLIYNISFGVGRHNNVKVDNVLFDDPAWRIAAVAPNKEMARLQLGTVGSGNHYVDIFHDETGAVWVGCHFGSRGLGHKTATWFLQASGAKDGIFVEPSILPVNSDLGEQYLECMRLAGLYAYAGRDFVCDTVAGIMGADIVEEVHNHHNFAWREHHNGSDMWVVRKGATPAFPGQKGFVGGSMGENSVILEGVENEDAKYSLYSTVHGAGRVLGRAQAIGKKDKKTGEVIRPGLVSKDMMQDWIRKANVMVRGGGVDESPHCYKRLDEVLTEHANSVKILHTLTPVAVAMAGEDEFDPFRD